MAKNRSAVKVSVDNKEYAFSVRKLTSTFSKKYFVFSDDSLIGVFRKDNNVIMSEYNPRAKVSADIKSALYNLVAVGFFDKTLQTIIQVLCTLCTRLYLPIRIGSWPKVLKAYI